MKTKFLLTVFLLLISLSIFSQKETKWHVLTSGISFTPDYDSPFITGIYSKTNDSFKKNLIGISPQVGYNISNNVAVGLVFGYAHLKEEDKTTSVNTIKNTFGIRPYVDYTIYRNGRFGIFMELAASYINSKTSGDKENKTGFGSELLPNITYRVSDHFCLNASYGKLSYYKFEDEKQFDLNLKMNSIQFSLVYLF